MTTRGELDELRTKIAAGEKAATEFPSIADMVKVQLAEWRKSLESGEAKFKLEETLLAIAKDLPTNIETLGNVRFVKRLAADPNGALETSIQTQGSTGETITSKVKASWQWFAEVNHTCQVKATGKGKVNGTNAVLVRKIVGDKVETLGTYPTAEAACKSLGIESGNDSAKRVLEREGYLVSKSA